jgi:hypothetical protein
MMNTKQIYVVGFGISNYRHLSNLSYAAKDARDIVEVFRCGSVSAKVKLFLNKKVTKQAILRELKWLANTAGPNDTAIIFFAGHGGRQSEQAADGAYFCPVEASLTNVKQTCISDKELTVSLSKIKSKRLVVFLDTCYSGGIGKLRSRSTGLDMALTSRDVGALIEGRGRMIMAASRPDEPAWEIEGLQNGLFTNYLLRGLRGDAAREDGTIWISELFGYVSRYVMQYGYQHPFQKAVGEDFVVIIQKTKISNSRLILQNTSLENKQRLLRLAMKRTYNLVEFSILCRDIGLSIEDLSGTTLEAQIMDLIDYCQRHGIYNQLIELIRKDRPLFTEFLRQIALNNQSPE